MPLKPFAFIAAAALTLSLAAGCAKSSDTSTSAMTTPAPSSAATAAAVAQSGAVALGDAAHGKQIFETNCSQCHGATGTEGGVGPPLKNEKSRKNYRATIAWIKNPTAPMPKLYPSPLSEKDVADVAAFVQTL